MRALSVGWPVGLPREDQGQKSSAQEKNKKNEYIFFGWVSMHDIFSVEVMSAGDLSCLFVLEVSLLRSLN